MNWKLGDSKRGVFFTLDSVFAIMILMTLFSLFMLLSVETVSTENLHQQLRFQAEDAVIILAKTTLKEVRYLPVVQEMQASGTLVQIDEDYSIMEVVGALWATNDTKNMTYAGKLVEQTLGPSMKNIKWSATIDNETVYNTSAMANARFMSTVSNRLISGYMKGRPHVGYTARAFLSNIRGKAENAYLFFGGFTGQGDISGYITGIPSDATILGVYIEATAGSNFNLYVNGTQCSDVELPARTITINDTDTGYLSWDLPNCTKFVKKGSNTRVNVSFTSTNVSKQYLGGGYVKVTYQTARFSTEDTGKMRYYFPGILGIINLYDSFFVPGKITGITGLINISSNYSTYIKLGSATIYNRSGNQGFGFNATNLINDSISINLSTAGLDFDKISNTTVPLRFGTPEATFVFGGQASDVIMVTDVSGSMAWCADQTETCCNRESGTPNCDLSPCLCNVTSLCDSCQTGESCGYESTFLNDSGTIVCTKRPSSSNCTAQYEKKIESVKAAQMEFAGRILGPQGSRLGIVDYSSNKSGVIVLPDINVTSIDVTPNGTYPGVPTDYTYSIKVKNDGFAPVLIPFRVAVFFPATPMRPFNITVDPPLKPGQEVTLTKTVRQTFGGDTDIWVWADCGGNYSHTSFGFSSGTVESNYPNLCPPLADQYGVVGEYKEAFDGGNPYLKNNFRLITLKTGINLAGYIGWSSSPFWWQSVYSLPENYLSAFSEPVICTTNDNISGRNAYDQTMLIRFNVTNFGALDIPSDFNVTLRRWNPKCSYWETIRTASLGLCSEFSQVYGGPIDWECDGGGSFAKGNPIQFTVPFGGFHSFPAHYSFNGTFVWDVENYTTPTCPFGAPCAFGSDCNDFADPAYFRNASFNLSIVVDPENNIPESSESDNTNIWATKIRRNVTDIRLVSISTNPNSRCADTTLYHQITNPLDCGSPCDCGSDILPSWMDTRLTDLQIILENPSDCPVRQPFSVKLWRQDEWCPTLNWYYDPGWASFYFWGSPYRDFNGPALTHNCSWTYCGAYNYTRLDPRQTSITSQSIPNDCSWLNMTEYFASCAPSFTGHYAWYNFFRSAGQLNFTARVDTNWSIGTSWSPPPNTWPVGSTPFPGTWPPHWPSLYGFVPNQSWPFFTNWQYSQINESNESNNWANTTVGTYTLADLTTDPLPTATPAIKDFRYGTSGVVHTVCFSNASMGANHNYNVNFSQIVRNDPNACPINFWIEYNMSRNCATCNPFSTGASCAFMGNNAFENLSSGEAKILYWYTTPNMQFVSDYTLCAGVNPRRNIAEITYDNNIGSYTLTARPTDLTPRNGSDVWNFTDYAQGVTLAPNGTALTCYGAKTKTVGSDTYRYKITGPVINNGADCSFIDNFTLDFGTFSTFTGDTFYYFGEGTGVHQQVVTYPLSTRMLSNRTQLPPFFVGPGQRTQFTLYWRGNTTTGDDYSTYFTPGAKSFKYLYVSANTPAPYVYNYPAETDFSNNWYTNPNFKIEYYAPDMQILEINKSRDDATNIYTINVSITNYEPSLAQCDTALQSATFNLTLVEDATSIPPKLIENRSISNLLPGRVRVLTFTYGPIDKAHEMSFRLDKDNVIIENNETNNELGFQVRVGGSPAPPEHNPNILLEEKLASEKDSSSAAVASSIPADSVQLQEPEPKPVSPISGMLLSGTRKERSANLAPIPGSDTCSFSASPTSQTGPFYSTITSSITDVSPFNLYTLCSINCGTGTSNYTGGVGSARCYYPAVGSIMIYPITGTCTDEDLGVSITCSGTSVTDNPGAPSPTCTGGVSASPSTVNVGAPTTITANYQNIEGRSVTICCQPSDCTGTNVVTGGIATRSCTYASAGSYTATSNYSAVTCAPTASVTVTAPGGPTCVLTANVTNGIGPFFSKISITPTNSDQCQICCGGDATHTCPGVWIQVIPGSGFRTCSYPAKGTTTVYNAQGYCSNSTSGDTFCYLDITDWPPAGTCGDGTCGIGEACTCPADCPPGSCTQTCSISASPSSGMEPLTSTVSVTYTNLNPGEVVKVCCDGTSDCSNLPLDSTRTANKSCTYNSAGAFTLYSNHSGSGASCTGAVSVSPNIWEDFLCPDSLDTHIVKNTTYQSYPIYTNSIVGKVDLKNLTDAQQVYDHINNTQTLHGTCMCCGILEAVEMFRNDPERMLSSTKPASIVLLSDGQPTEGCSGWSKPGYSYPLTGDPRADVTNASCIAKQYNVTVFTIGFGKDADTNLMNLTAKACGGEGEYYYAKDRSELIQKYSEIAASILNVSYTSQSIQVSGTGFTNSTLDGDSYLEFTYNPFRPTLGWNDITVTLETPPFPSCTGGQFTVSPNVTAYHAIATSYSGSYWTREVKLNDNPVFDIDNYKPAGVDTYKEIGDPFNIQFAPNFVSSSSSVYWNNITYTIGEGPTNIQTPEKCGIHNKLIYSAKFPAAVPFSSVLPDAICRKVKVYYDLDGDGDATDPDEGYATLFIGQGLVGISCDEAAAPFSVPQLADDAKTNAVADSMMRLLNQLNYNPVKDASCIDPGCTGTCVPPSGSICNPIDIYIDPNNLASRASSIYEVPYMYGPYDVGIKVWVD